MPIDRPIVDVRHIALPGGGSLEVQMSADFIARARQHFGLLGDQPLDDDHVKLFVYGTFSTSVAKAERGIRDDDAQVQQALVDIDDSFAAQALQGKRPTAAFTVVRDDDFFVDLWCAYYGQELEERNLYVLDNSPDMSAMWVTQKYPGVHVLNVPSDKALDWAWISRLARSFQRSALRLHDAVVYADADEYLLPRRGSLADFCRRFVRSDRQYVRAQGWGVVHQVATEPPVIRRGSPLDRRSSMWRMPGYDKTLLSKVPLAWSKGNHAIYNDGNKLVDDPVDPGLCLLHGRDIDYDVYLERARHRRAMDPSGAGFTYSTDADDVRQYFRTLKPTWGGQPSDYVGDRTAIPKAWKKRLVWGI